MHEVSNAGWYKHCTMRNPMHDLAFFMHRCAQDPVTRVMGNTALVLALLQTAGPSMISQPPGFLLINAGSETLDPIDALVRKLSGMGRPRQRPEAEVFERNEKTMNFLTLQRELQAQNPVNDLFKTRNAASKKMADEFNSLLAMNHGGTGRAGYYADRRNPDYGWITDASGHSILRLERQEDFRQLREDLDVRIDCLNHPTGCGAELKRESKKLSIAGSFPAADWESYYTDPIIQNGLPVLFLPHNANRPLEVPEHLAMEWIGIGLGSEASKSRSAPPEAYRTIGIIGHPWHKARLAGLRERLSYMPMDYEFFVMRTIRELMPCCQRLIKILAPKTTPSAEQTNLAFDLYLSVLHGICMGVESLGWYGYGFETPGCFVEMRSVLNAVRERGSLSKREMLRLKKWLTAESRDAILDVLIREGLIKLTDNEITALPFTDYWQRIVHRSFGELPQPLWEGAAQMQQTKEPPQYNTKTRHLENTLEQVDEICLTEKQFIQWRCKDTKRADVFELQGKKMALKGINLLSALRKQPALPSILESLGVSEAQNDKSKLGAPALEPTHKPKRRKDAVWNLFSFSGYVIGVHEDGTVVTRLVNDDSFDHEYRFASDGLIYKYRRNSGDEILVESVGGFMELLEIAFQQWIKRRKDRKMPLSIQRVLDQIG
jgi:hypothetical protein